ncbi:hypothetical protein [Nocardia sp. NPDC049149]|uniref:hypothetical protein n=1 Tax=Nocardia sp. NPDC049149 TaxID=3364315 RepID=UPI00371DBAC5
MPMLPVTMPTGVLAAGLAVTDGARVWVFIHEQHRTPEARTEAGSLQRLGAPR